MIFGVASIVLFRLLDLALAGADIGLGTTVSAVAAVSAYAVGLGGTILHVMSLRREPTGVAPSEAEPAYAANE